MLGLRNRNGAWVDDFKTLKELQACVIKLGWKRKDYIIVDKC